MNFTSVAHILKDEQDLEAQYNLMALHIYHLVTHFGDDEAQDMLDRAKKLVKSNAPVFQIRPLKGLTKTRQAAKKIKSVMGRGGTIYNDRMVDGGRSLKVEGWDKSNYLACKGLLEAEGCLVQLVESEITRKSYFGPVTYKIYRLHVQENG
jgi:hypothetical protein